MEIAFTYRQYRPSALMAAHVECYWTWQGDCPAGRVERLIPGGRVELIFNLGDEVQWLMDGLVLRGTHIMGQRDRLFFCRPQGKVRLFGVRFRPGCFGAFAPTPLHLLLNRLLPAAELLGPGVEEMYQQLWATGSDECRVRLVEEGFCPMLAGTPSSVVQAALDTMRRVEGISVEAMCEQVGWGYKRMERAFLKEVGYTPKGYSRLVRFNKAIRRMDGTTTLTSVGHACGYYDQAHFIKDFSRFAGMTPGQFRPEENPVAELLIRNQAV
ncbi:helix-turn-helix transcriptional regulator [Puia sp.]|uniref:helix-turn-helix transcriptional regulator n=1 Tax=Puia sp. TaxID=2045100 RepID=UPI002F3E4D9B